jgi:hypothetical protein
MPFHFASVLRIVQQISHILLRLLLVASVWAYVCWYGMVWYGMAWYVWYLLFGMYVMYGMYGVYGMVRYGTVWYGMVWDEMVCMDVWMYVCNV